MEDGTKAKLRVEALNLAYGILLNKYQAGLGKPATIGHLIPTTVAVLEEAKKLTEFIEGP
jgi:hypothetical protein